MLLSLGLIFTTLRCVVLLNKLERNIYKLFSDALRMFLSALNSSYMEKLQVNVNVFDQFYILGSNMLAERPSLELKPWRNRQLLNYFLFASLFPTR